jgi:hypothetical protein
MGKMSIGPLGEGKSVGRGGMSRSIAADNIRMALAWLRALVTGDVSALTILAVYSGRFALLSGLKNGEIGLFWPMKHPSGSVRMACRGRWKEVQRV